MVTRTRLRPVPAGGIDVRIIAPPRALSAPESEDPECPECPECPPLGTTPPISEWVDLHTLVDLQLDDITREGSVYETSPSDTTTTVFINAITYLDPATNPLKGLLCVLIPEDPAVMLSQLWAITAAGVYIADYNEDHVSTVFLTTTYFLTGQTLGIPEDDHWLIGQVFVAYQTDGGISTPVRFRIKAIHIPAVPLP